MGRTMGTTFGGDKIFIGNTKIDKDGIEIWTKKEDVTDMAIKAVFEYMYLKAEETGAFQLSIKGFGKMTFVREKK